MKQALSNSQIESLNKRDYFIRLTSEIKHTKPGSRILVTTMTLLPDQQEVQDLASALIHAARQNSEVHIGFDAYNFLVNPRTKQLGPMFYNATLSQYKSGIYKDLLLFKQHLESSGVNVYILNKPTRALTNPFSGRSHVKTAIINDSVFLGGCNLSKPDDIDIMLRFNSKPTADWLYEVLLNGLSAPSVRAGLHNQDFAYKISGNSKLLIDAGVPKQSLIYDNALNLIDNAKNWLYITCQFFPNSLTATRLLAAHRRGVKVQIVYNHPFRHAGFHNKALQSMVRLRERLHMPKSFFDNELPLATPFLHAKVIASEQGAIVGSHNYVKAGVDFGTAEIALLRHDKDFGTAVKEFIQNQVIQER